MSDEKGNIKINTKAAIKSSLIISRVVQNYCLSFNMLLLN